MIGHIEECLRDFLQLKLRPLKPAGSPKARAGENHPLHHRPDNGVA